MKNLSPHLMQHSFNQLILDSIQKNWDLPALTDFKGTTYHYRDVAQFIAKNHILFKATGIQKGDKIALCGRNCANWAISFLSIVTYGAVVVPILNDFKADNIHHIVNHSDSKILIASDQIWENLNEDQMTHLECVISMTTRELIVCKNDETQATRLKLNALFGELFPKDFTAQNVSYFIDQPDELMLINYTSGSTGFSKGVMLPYRSIWSNVQYCLDNLNFFKTGDSLVSMLPMAHMYGLAVEVLYPIARGAHVHFLTRTPSPKIIMEAFAQIKPKMIVAVPLILEKIIKTRVFPLLERPLVKLMLHVPFLDQQLLNKVKAQLTETFGGNLCEIIIGGAAMNKEVESFLRKIEFPFTIGYGMTECGPLISYAPWQKSRATSCGHIVDRMQVRVASEDPENIVGEIQVKGTNVMLGYYKNEEATQAIFHEDGWMSTGDLGVVDQDNYIYLRGRSKNMILGPSGQNIYPEEIEEILNNLPYVSESIVIEKEGKLVALIYPDFDSLERENIPHEKIEEKMEENRKTLNPSLPAYSQVNSVKIYFEEFEKTPKKSIKRYLYQ